MTSADAVGIISTVATLFLIVNLAWIRIPFQSLLAFMISEINMSRKERILNDTDDKKDTRNNVNFRRSSWHLAQEARPWEPNLRLLQFLHRQSAQRESWFHWDQTWEAFFMKNMWLYRAKTAKQNQVPIYENQTRRRVCLLRSRGKNAKF